MTSTITGHHSGGWPKFLWRFGTKEMLIANCDVDAKTQEENEVQASQSFSTYTAENLRNFRDCWEQIKSTNMQYNAGTDIFDSIILARILDTIEENVFILIFRHAFRYASFLVAILALGLAYFNPEANISPSADNSVFQNILYIASFMGLSEEFTQHNYIFLLAVALMSFMASNLVIDVRVGTLKKSIKTITQQEIQKLENMRQIYPGSGNIKFSAGTEGFAIQSDNFDMLFQWPCLEDIWFVQRQGTDWNRLGLYSNFLEKSRLVDALSDDDSEKAGRHMEAARVEFFDQLERATHVFMVLKPTSNHKSERKPFDINDMPSPDQEFIVVPKEFFDNPRSANDWAEFWPILQDARPI